MVPMAFSVRIFRFPSMENFQPRENFACQHAKALCSTLPTFNTCSLVCSNRMGTMPLFLANRRITILYHRAPSQQQLSAWEATSVRIVLLSSRILDIKDAGKCLNRGMFPSAGFSIRLANGDVSTAPGSAPFPFSSSNDGMANKSSATCAYS